MKSILFMMVLVFSNIGLFAQKENIPIVQPQPQPSPPPSTNTSKPYSLVRMNVEAWLEDSILTIQFYQSEGDATITLNCGDGNGFVELTFSTDAPIVIDLNLYDDTSSFIVETTLGRC